MIDIPRDREHVPFFPSRCAFFFLRVVRDKTWMRPWEMGGVRLYTHAGLHRAESHFLAKNAIQYGHGSLPPPSFVLHPFPERYPSPTLHSSIYKTFIVVPRENITGHIVAPIPIWLFHVNFRSQPPHPIEISPRSNAIFSSFLFFFSSFREGGGGGGLLKGRVERLNYIAVNRAFVHVPRWFFFHDIVSRIYTFFSSEENRFYESQTAVKRAVEILSS